MSEPVEVRGLAKTFYDENRGEIQAVKAVDFQCREGEIFGLLGANGAGKTTTLRMLATILAPTAGSATILGHDVTAEPAAVRRKLGFFSASTALYPRLTARETIEFFARINQYPSDQVLKRVGYLVERFGLASYADARIERSSSSPSRSTIRSRAGSSSIARTVAHDPPLLIFDEPTVGLDVLNALEMQEVIKEFRNQGKTIVFSTHIMSEAEKLCDRIAIIHGGRILACDTLEKLRQATGARYLEDIFVHYVKSL